MASTISPGVSQSVSFLFPFIVSPVVHAYLSAVAPAPRSRSSPPRGSPTTWSTSVLLASSCVCVVGTVQPKIAATASAAHTPAPIPSEIFQNPEEA